MPVAQAVVHILKMLEIRLGDVFQDKFLVFSARSTEASKLDSVSRRVSGART